MGGGQGFAAPLSDAMCARASCPLLPPMLCVPGLALMIGRPLSRRCVDDQPPASQALR